MAEESWRMRTIAQQPDRWVELSQLLTKIQHDPLLKRELGDRVYQLMQQDLRVQRERRGNGQ
jgi:hypothetical protein